MENATPLERLRIIMRQLRNPDGGCPWDLEQDFKSIAPYAIEEAYEVLDAIERDDMAALKEELGDLLLQVMFHSQMADEQDLFDFDDVTTAIADKMVARHPHVFGNAAIRTTDEQLQSWEAQKSAERGAAGEVSALDGVAAALPALMRAEKLQNRAARVGFAWHNAADVFKKLDEEINELKVELAAKHIDQARLQDELGDMLFVMTNLCRVLKCDPETTLRQANQKFERRFKAMEIAAVNNGQKFAELNILQQENLWQFIKRQK